PAENARGMIAVDKMGGKVLFLDPATYATEVVIDGFPRTVHELLVMPEAGLAYVPIFGDGIHGRNPNPGHLIAVIDLTQRTHIRDIGAPLYRAAYAAARAGRPGLHHVREQCRRRSDKPGGPQGGRDHRFRLDQRPPPRHLVRRAPALYRE